MGFFGESIVKTGRRSRNYAEKLLVGIKAEQFHRKPVFGTTMIDCSHPAFIYGHLCLYPARLLKMASANTTGVEAPAGWEDLFKAGVACQDDPTGQLYPSMKTLSETFFKFYDTAFERIEKLPDSAFDKPNPDERYREAFPSVGAACLVLLNNHVAMHMGQVSTWRRCMGLGPA